MKTFFLLLFSFTVHCCCAQNTAIYSLQRSQATYKIPWSNYLTNYDYVTGSYDTTLSFTGSFFDLGYAAIDAWNGRYFLVGRLDSNESPGIITIDMATKTVRTSKKTFADGEVKDIEYDPFLNSLVFIDTSGYLTTFNVETEELQKVGYVVINNHNSVYSENAYTYDPVMQQYAFVSSVSKDSFVLVSTSVNENANIRVIGLPQFSFFLTYDFVHKIYHGLSFKNSLFSVISIDSAGKVSTVEFSEMHSTLNSQNAVLDIRNEKFIFPYLNINTESKIGIIDAGTNSPVSANTLPDIGSLQRLDAEYDPIIRYTNNNYLVTTYGAKYQWYRCGEAISGATSQTIDPAVQGAYYAEVTFTNGRKAISNEVMVSKGVIDKSIEVYPNPANRMTTVNLHCYALKSIALYDANGRQVFQQDLKYPQQTYDINTTGLAEGIYYIDALGSDNVLRTGKLVVK